ncbi:hypothetical protein, variant [Aphanomyces invadans]|nr:hypothetical protein, variant [Aphanomyces invadans]ETV98798.1 hypothetical protein, variant [Aphanomyces invadans]|eukprot:XP_008872225.1 hypothetical protein, variant [Aphanomyces invadans]
MDSEMCVVGTFPGNPDKVLLVLQKQKFGRGDALRLIRSMTLRRMHENDVYSNHIGVLSGDNDALRVTMIYPATAAHIAKHSEQSFYMAEETAAIYNNITLPYIESIPSAKIQWVYNILDGTSEAEKIILDDSDPTHGFVLLPDTKWSAPYHVESLYCLAIVRDRSIRSVRDLRAPHVPMLESLRAKGLAVIREKYGVAASSVRCFVHYQPSYYHFHVHFTHVKVACGISVGKAILIQDILHNLSMHSDYYVHAQRLLRPCDAVVSRRVGAARRALPSARPAQRTCVVSGRFLDAVA